MLYIRGVIKIKILKNLFKLTFCLFCLTTLSGCLLDSNLSGDSNTSSLKDMDTENENSTPFKESHSVSPSSNSNKLDVLVVLPGGSVSEKARLGLILSRLLSDTSFQSIDWQVAFISEDVSQNNSSNGLPTLLPLRSQNGVIQETGVTGNSNIYVLSEKLEENDHILNELFIETMSNSVGTGAQPLTSIIQSIGKTENQIFFRSDAVLATIILTKGQDANEGTPSIGVIKSIQQYLEESQQFGIYGLITEIGDVECAEAQTQDATSFSYAVSELIGEAEGIVGSICEEDYSKFIAQVGFDIKEKFVVSLSEITLKHTNVIEDTISLTFTPAKNEQSPQFDSEENKITFDTPVSEGTDIEVSYRYLNDDDSTVSNP